MKVATVSLASVIATQGGLRPAQVKSEKFQGLMRSIQAVGQLESVLVRPSEDEDGKFLLINGLQRFTALSMLGAEEIAVRIVEGVNDAATMSLQIQSNLHTVDTKPAEYGRQLMNMIALNGYTIKQLSEMLCVQPQWIMDRLALNKLHPDIQAEVDAGEVQLFNATQLARLPMEEQEQYLERAKTEPTTKFQEAVKARLSQIREAASAGKTAGEEVFVACAKIRGKAIIQDELNSLTVGITKITPDTPAHEAWKMAIEWVLNLDAETVAIERGKWEAAKAAAKALKDEKAAKKEAEKAAKAAETIPAV